MNKLTRRRILLLAVLVTVTSFHLSGAQVDQWTEETPASPQVPQSRTRDRSGRIYRARVTPHWFANNTRFWYRNDLPGGAREFILIDAVRGAREQAFDHQSVAKQIGGNTDAAHLPVEELKFSKDGRNVSLLGETQSWELDLISGRLETLAGWQAGSALAGLPADLRSRASRRTGPETEITFDNQLDREVELFWLDDQGARQSYGKLAPHNRKTQHTFSGHVWLVADGSGETVAVFEATDRPDVAVIRADLPQSLAAPPASGHRRIESDSRSPDGKWTVLIKEDNLFIRGSDGAEIQLSTDGSEDNAYGRPEWSSDSQTLVAWRTEPGHHKEVYLIHSSPPGGGRAQFEARDYALPGDKFKKSEVNLFEVASRKRIKPEVDRFEDESQWPQLHWNRDGSRFSYEQVDRGHQRLRVIEVDARSGAVRNLVDERSDTFIWTAHADELRLRLVNWMEQSDEIIYVSERDGWRHLYLVDMKDAKLRSITKGEWVVRGIERIDEENRQIWFSAGGRNPDQDPYFLHYYRVNFDGTGLTALTEGNGNHRIEFSLDRKYLIDTWSRVDALPVNELRRASDGKLVCKLEEADITELTADGWEPPEVFVAKGRDAKTDIWGVIYRPRHFDPNKRYPVIEDIYAGPHGSFVPKSFGGPRYQMLTEAGFIVAKVDGMGTANRSKAFHDVCWKNLKDAGFPDRILWHQAVAGKYPYYDISRVGIYGTSAGGQSAAGAVLFHPEFYKAAVANSGCHDNRMDKASWNEQWMGYPIGPQYAECSNIENAARLQGHLFLVVGEMDKNVPPESTMRFVDSLVRARKDFDLLVIPNGGHGAGGEYYQRRLKDFFVRYLQGVEPTNHNAPTETPAGS